MTIYRSGAAWAGGAILCMAGGAAIADVTPAQVWADWSAGMAGYGLTVTAQETPSGNDLKLSDIVLSKDAPEEGADAEVSFPEMTLRDNGDGTVTVDLPDRLPVAVAVNGEEPVSFTLVYTTTDMDMTVSGDPSEMIYAYKAASVGIALTDLVSEGKPVDIETATISMQDVESNTKVTAGDLRQTDQQISSGPVTYEVVLNDLDEDVSKFNLTGRLDTVTMMGKVAIPGGVGLDDMAAALAAGFAADGSYTFGPGTSSTEITQEDGVTQTGTTSAGGVLSVKMTDEIIHYGATTNDLAVNVRSPSLPFPIEMAMKEAKFGLDMPIAEKQEAQDFGLNLLLGDLTVSDAIWAMFDAGAKLPRDPASLVVDLSGKARVMANLMDPARMKAIEDSDQIPAEVDALSLNRLLLRLAGAELAGKGSLTFDNSDKKTYDGIPKPVGDIDLSLTGSNALLDRLVAMGLVPQDQVMGVRMMMSVFTVPGEGEDVLKSKIEFTDNGQILANGQRLK